MNKLLVEQLPKIEDWLSLEEIASFKIGITSNIQQRSLGYSSQKNVQLIALAEGSPLAIQTAETDLINYFLASPLKDKCENQPNTGGIGNVTDVKTLYIAIEHANDNPPIEELHIPFNDVAPIQLED